MTGLGSEPLPYEVVRALERLREQQRRLVDDFLCPWLKRPLVNGYYRLTSERSSMKSIVQHINGEWYCVNESGPVTLEELNRRGWVVDSPVEDMEI